MNVCTKDMHFTFNNQVYKQNDGVCMGNLLGPVIANIFMVELECTLVPRMGDALSEWIRYVDDTFTFVRKGELQNILEMLNSFHSDIQFTYETEQNCMIPFLDVQVRRKADGAFTTSVYRKKTSSDIYINWNSYAPRTWKIGTLYGLVQRAFTICSDEHEIEKEIRYLKRIFGKVNCYPTKIIENTIAKVRNKNAQSPEGADAQAEAQPDEPGVQRPYMSLPYGGDKGNTIIRDFKRTLEHTLPNTVKPEISVKGKKIASHFNAKDKIDDRHISGFVYEFNCNRRSTCTDDYIGETNRRKEIRVHEHGSTDESSAILQHSRSKKHAKAKDKNFTILARNYPHWRRRKICESMFIRDKNPSLNKQGDKHRQSYKLHLFA